MNFWMYSKSGEGAGLMKAIEDAGNKVSLYIEETAYRSCYRGILKQSSYPKEGDIVIFDTSGNGKKADQFRKKGFDVFGAGEFADTLEHDRKAGTDFMEICKIPSPETVEFDGDDWNDAIKYIKGSPGRWVFKPSGPDLPTKLTYVSSDMEDLLLYVEFVREQYGHQIENFILQEFVEGALVSTEGFVGPGGFIEPFNHTIETKKFMNGDIGPSTGCSGNLVWLAEHDNRIVRLLRNAESELVANGYVGPIDINCIITDDDIWGLEWTPRFGLDAMPTILQLVQDPAKWIADVVKDQVNWLDFKDLFAGGIRVSIPPYPIETDKVKQLGNQCIPIRNLDSEGTYYYEVMKEHDTLVHSDGTGVIACVSCVGAQPEVPFRDALKIIEGSKIPDKQYRTDLQELIPKMYRELMEVM